MSETQLKELISKHKQDNSTLESEIVKLKSEISNSLNSQNELKSRNMDLEKELRQSRLQHKLKISQLQKEISSMSSGSPASERNRSSSATPVSNQTKPTQSVQVTLQTTDMQSMTDELSVVATQSIATQATVNQSVATQFIATQVGISDLQPVVGHDDSASVNISNTSAEAVHPGVRVLDAVVMMDAFSQTEIDFSTDEKSAKKTEEAVEAVEKVNEDFKKEMEEKSARKTEEAVEKVKEDLKKEMEEKIVNLRNVHKENISSLTVQIQELKAELVSFLFSNVRKRVK
jgi:predicted  nucleic acid-binding Zn-ribbon protein